MNVTYTCAVCFHFFEVLEHTKPMRMTEVTIVFTFGRWFHGKSTAYVGKVQGAHLVCFGSVKINQALAGVAQWIEGWPMNQKIAGSIPSQGTCLGCRPGPQWGECERQPHLDVSLALSLLPFLSL